MGRTGFTCFMTLAALWCGAGGCKYDPQPADGTLRCSTSGECPDGYSCRVNTCWSNAGGPRDGGLGGDAIPPAVLNRYIGSWVLDPTAKVVTMCDDGFVDTTLLSPVSNPSIMTITRGTPPRSDLDSMWLCPALSLRLDSTGAHLFSGGSNCLSDSSQNPTQTWTATAFDVLSADGTTGSHMASYNRLDRYTDGSVVNCAQTVTAALVKR
jgi:hypothetical protein